MHLSPKEVDRLLLFQAAELARRRRARGLRLNYPEARALIADEICEMARDGLDVATCMGRGAEILTADDVLPGVPALIDMLQVEAMFADGEKLVTVHEPIPAGASGGPPGEVVAMDGEIELNAGRTVVTLVVRNLGDRPIQVGSHFHFFEVNRELAFDRAAAFGMRLDVPAGTAVRFEPGDELSVDLVALGQEKEVWGLNRLTQGSAGDDGRAVAAARAATAGFRGA